MTTISRRGMLRFLGGGAAGIFLTPLPWKLLDDSAIWTQNWPWMPKPPRGPVTYTTGVCTLCTAACPLKIRLVGGIPVSVAGFQGHRISGGAVCPVGLGVHHLSYHPQRINEPLRRTSRNEQFESCTLESALVATVASFRRAQAMKKEENIVILDRQPNRSVSAIYADFARAVGGAYVTQRTPEQSAYASLNELFGSHGLRFGFDASRISSMLLFGVPHISMPAGKDTDIMCVRSDMSGASVRGAKDIGIIAGSELWFALGVGRALFDLGAKRNVHVPLGQTGRELVEFVERYSLDDAASRSGVAAVQIRETAEMLLKKRPSIVASFPNAATGSFEPETESAIQLLNILAGNFDAGASASVYKPLLSAQGIARCIEELPDGSVDFLLIDGSESGYALPWNVIERKLAGDTAAVAVVAPFACGLAAHANIVIPASAPLEELYDGSQGLSEPSETYTVSQPIRNAPEGCVKPAAFILAIMNSLGVTPEFSSVEAIVHKKCLSILRSGKGTVYVPSQSRDVPVSEFLSPDDLLKALNEGGVWMGQVETAANNKVINSASKNRQGSSEIARRLEEQARASEEKRLRLSPVGSVACTEMSAVTPLVTKLNQESTLLLRHGYASVNPATASALGVKDGDKVVAKTAKGEATLVLNLEPSVAPDIVWASAMPNNPFSKTDKQSACGILNLCEADAEGAWRFTPVELRKA